MLSRPARTARAAALSILLAALAACGGGGGAAPGDAAGAATTPSVAPTSGPAPGASSGPSAAAADPAADASVKIFAVTPQSGGTATLDGVGTVRIPAGALAAPVTAQLQRTASDHLQAVFDDTAVMFAARIRSSYELRITLGAQQPASDVEVELPIPAGLRMRAARGDEVRPMALNIHESELERHESVELLAARARPSDAIVRAHLAATDFQPNTDGRFEAAVFLALTPTAPTAPQAFRARLDRLFASLDPIGCAHAEGAGCAGASLSRPVDEQFRPSSPFGRRAKPVAGASTDHKGIDFATPIGTPVRAAADGTLEVARFQTDPATGRVIGWGYFIVVRHQDGGATLYAHLTPHSEILPIGSRFKAGDAIARSGNSGTSGGPHLHFEYAPSGRIFVRDHKVDPLPCLERLAAGSVTVRDNGYAADDAFSVTIEGRPLCSTTTGAANLCAIGQLRPGRYTLDVTVDEAPDNIGTYEITAHEPNVLIDSGKRVSGSVPQGGTVRHELRIAP